MITEKFTCNFTVHISVFIRPLQVSIKIPKMLSHVLILGLKWIYLILAASSDKKIVLEKVVI